MTMMARMMAFLVASVILASTGPGGLDALTSTDTGGQGRVLASTDTGGSGRYAGSVHGVSGW